MIDNRKCDNCGKSLENIFTVYITMKKWGNRMAFQFCSRECKDGFNASPDHIVAQEATI